jgi:hypothetical protein
VSPQRFSLAHCTELGSRLRYPRQGYSTKHIIATEWHLEVSVVLTISKFTTPFTHTINFTHQTVLLYIISFQSYFIAGTFDDVPEQLIKGMKLLCKASEELFNIGLAMGQCQYGFDLTFLELEQAQVVDPPKMRKKRSLELLQGGQGGDGELAKMPDNVFQKFHAARKLDAIFGI